MRIHYIGKTARVEMEFVPRKKINALIHSSLIPYSKLILRALISISDVIMINKKREIRTRIQT